MRDELFREYRKLYKRMHIRVYSDIPALSHIAFPRLKASRIFARSITLADHGTGFVQCTHRFVPRQTRVIVLIEGIMHTRGRGGGGGARHRLDFILWPWLKQSCQMLPSIDSLRRSRKSKPFPPIFAFLVVRAEKEYEF